MNQELTECNTISSDVDDPYLCPLCGTRNAVAIWHLIAALLPSDHDEPYAIPVTCASCGAKWSILVHVEDPSDEPGTD